ncbi:DUF4406 domain-containing protein [Herbiconiux sp. SALV-R1]|nr:DUF4406 domain-containing protein [Herbiconiux sp. SALV-R1]
MKVYIAGPMTGLPLFNYPAFNEAAAHLRALGHTPLNPARHDIAGPIKPWDYYMRDALSLVIQADGIALLSGWEDSRGAVLEHILGDALGMDIRPLEGWLS